MTTLREAFDKLLQKEADPPPFERGEHVHKKNGYKWPGVVLSCYRDSRNTKWCVVVECTVPEIEGAQHIFSPDQLEHRS